MLGTQEKLKSCQGLYETMELLRAVRPEYMKEAFLVQEVETHVSCILSFYCPELTRHFISCFSPSRPLPSSTEITRAAINAWLLLQITELPVTEKDIEKEHHAQLRRWKETHGDLRCMSPPRMHGAKAIMAAEPPSRQDLRQQPTIIVESPLAEKDGERAENSSAITAKTNKDKVKDAAQPPPPVNPHLLSTDPNPLLPNAAPSGSKESLSSGEHDTYL